MSSKNVMVDDCLFTLTKDGWVISLEMVEDNIEDAVLMYDGRNCAILSVNKEKSYLLTNILPEVREGLVKEDKITILQIKNGEVINGYEVDIKHVDEIPYSDTLVEDMTKMVDKLKKEHGEEKYKKSIPEAFTFQPFRHVFFSGQTESSA